MKPIYLDYNATTPIDPVVVETMRPYLEEYFGNPSSTHWYGVQAKLAVEKARKQVAELLNCGADEIIFTSGGSESNNYAIKGAAFANRDKGNHIITSSIEHPAVSEVCQYLEHQGFQVTYVAVDEFGVVDLEALENAISPQTILVTVMHANNEVGTIQPVAEIAKIAKKHGVLMHTDAAQSVGKIPTDVKELGVDLLTVAGHKLYAPKGVGALYIRHGVKLEKSMHGADHEQNLRAGTENVLEIVGLGKACEVAKQDIEKNVAHMQKLRDQLYSGLRKRLPAVKLNGHPEQRLPNTLSLSFPNIEANMLLDELGGVAASAGAACHSDSIDVSPTLLAMAIPDEYAMGTIRFSTGKFTTEDDIERAIGLISEAVARLQPTEAGIAQADLDFSDIKLTHFTQGLGCACKLRPQALERILADLTVPDDAQVLVGLNTADDAAVYKLQDDTAIVQTVDFFTPIVDDPYHFGAIAAANAFSDVYAMGGRPVFALNIVGFPSNRLPMEILREILKGAQDKAKEAGVSIIGGHTVDDAEPKFGLAVTGLIHPEKILTNATAKPGDVLILTKPLGLGIITTAIKRGMVDEQTVEEAIRIMSTLNRKAADTMSEFNVNACTDISGFGLLGHLKEMVKASGVDAEVYADKVPIIEHAKDFITANVIPGGTLNNLDFVSDCVEWPREISRTMKTILCDAQTSGGLLISIPSNTGTRLEQALRANDIADASIVGQIISAGNGKIVVRQD
ncbi:MAG: selenide, water dikinase SelD [candidate division Zixibacteria bacterium]|nr:selenide, water dikinase SelD [candidate division Zixibacteria bacterium]